MAKVVKKYDSDFEKYDGSLSADDTVMVKRNGHADPVAVKVSKFFTGDYPITVATYAEMIALGASSTTKTVRVLADEQNNDGNKSFYRIFPDGQIVWDLLSFDINDL